MKKGFKFSFYSFIVTIGLTVTWRGLAYILELRGLMFRQHVDNTFFVLIFILSYIFIGGIIYALEQWFVKPQEDAGKRIMKKIASSVMMLCILLFAAYASYLAVFLQAIARKPEHVVEKNNQKTVAIVHSFLSVRVTYHEYKNFLVCGTDVILTEEYGKGGFDPFEMNPMPPVIGNSSSASVSLLEQISSEKLEVYVKDYPLASIIFSDGKSQAAYNEPSITQRHSPYSTYKILHSLIALEEHIVTPNESKLTWDGTPYAITEHNQDQNMYSAMKYSCVWYYQKLARKIGKEKMQAHLDNVGFGNRDISGGIDKFWLDSSLLVSPQEQIDFMIRLYENKLPFSQDNMSYVKSILQQDNDAFPLYGKTGSSGQGHGWFIGYTLIEEKPYYFSVYIEGENVDGPYVRDKTIKIISELLIKEKTKETK